jgi:hypothetical protein
MKQQGPAYKWKYAIGTTSRVPGSKLHYLIVDFDIENPRLGILLGYRPGHIFVQQTKNGWHVYTDLTFTFSKLCETLSIIGADHKWIEIGKQRGYFFLADKDAVYLPWPVERMQLHAKGREKGKSNPR